MPDTKNAVANASAIQSDALCPQCGYNLRGLLETRCPECGETFDPAVLSETILPWVLRRHLGRIRAYCQTVWLATCRPRLLAAQMSHRVAYRDSQSFRWATVVLAWLPFLFTTIYNWDGHGRMTWVLPTGDLFGLAVLPICHAASLLVLPAMTGLPSYFFHPKWVPVERQNRAIALSYYTCAPLAMGVLVWPFAAIFQGVTGVSSFGLALPATVLQMGFWLRSLIILSRRGLEIRTAKRIILLATAIPLLWLLVATLAYTAVLLIGVISLNVWVSVRN